MIGRVRELIARREAHAARTVVLLPFAHLIPLARAAWAAQLPTGFAPRFETSMTWSLSASFVPADSDLAFDMGRDLLTARALLEQAGLASRADLLAGRVVQAAWQLAPAAAAVMPAARPAWAARARQAIAAGFDAPVLAMERAVAGVALEWAAVSSYAGDALLEGELAPALDLLVVVEGLRPEPFAAALASLLAGKAVSVPLAGKAVSVPLAGEAPPGAIRLHEAADPADEAERAAACVLRHIQAGRVPVALPAVDRLLTRRIRALLDVRGAGIRDETGWKLSTTRAAAHLMLALRACAWNASADAVIDWIKHAPAVPSHLALALERAVRKAGLRDWRGLRSSDLGDGPRLQSLLEQVNGWRDRLQRVRSLPQWLADLRGLLQETGQWPRLAGDAAGARLIAALRLDEGAQAEFQQLPQAARRFGLADFSAWAGDTLEADSFVPQPAGQEQVVSLPFNQLLGRPFAALVLAGCDELRLPPAPEPAGVWTPAQRLAL
ncbi:MAG: PD-(D/E)XK nuclease family protein, partial [Ramlibacter sp.]|nr:PD-(D/E)XK nuclease family protein [Ramlibacter sp.]